MKLIKTSPVSAVTLGLILSGCTIGRNSTLFVTKSNVGFEASGKPPTFQLALSRKEGVVGPQFQNGQKLPVMASFRFANRGAFSPNVGSTFAAGDAATTLSALYGDKTPNGDWVGRSALVRDNSLPTDSTIRLNSEPTLKNWLPLPNWSWLNKLTGKPTFQGNDVRPVFFGTDTAVGIKVSWSGMTGTFPDSAHFGYNRKELALAPITMKVTNNVEKGVQTTSYDMKMSSLLATVDSGVNGVQNPDGSPVLNAQHLQYFATGNAATLLALQEDVRKAMLSRLDPNGETYKARFESARSQEHAEVLTRWLSWVYDSLKTLSSNPGAAGAVDHVQRLDALAGSFNIPRSFAQKGVIYFHQSVEAVGGATTMTLKEETAEAVQGAGTFAGVIAYWTGLQNSLNTLQAWKPSVDADLEIALCVDGKIPVAKAKLTADQKKTFIDQLTLQEQFFEAIDAKLRSNQEIVNAFQFLQGLIAPK